MRRAALASTLLSLAVLAGGCHGARIAEESYPPFHRGYSTAPESMRSGVEEERARFLESNGAPEALLGFARASGRLARHQIQRWLALVEARRADASAPTPDEAHARRGALESTRHALSLYRQYELSGGRLAARSRLEMSWLLLASGNDLEAGHLLEQLAADPAEEIDLAALAALRARLAVGKPPTP